jgi:hypothetical protein
MDLQALEVKQFHGGITDNFIDAQPHQYQRADNLLVTENAKLYTRPGSEIWDAINYQIPAGAQRIGSLHEHFGLLLTQSSKKVYYVSTTWQTLQGPSANDVFLTGDINSRAIWSDWNNHSFVTNDDFSPVMKIYKDQTSTLRVRNAGLPNFSSTPTCTKTVVGTNNYIYTFLYYYEYYVETVLFAELGPTLQVQVIDSATPDVGQIQITGIPSITPTQNYDTANIKVRIYRTQANGTTSTLLATINHGVATYNDVIADATIADNIVLYTDSGEASHEPPPLCKCLHITDTLGLYGHIKDSSGQIFKNRVRQGIPDDPDSCPSAFYVDFDDNVVAISSVGQTPVVLCERSIHRLDSFFSATGEGGLQGQEIESTVGCISATSVIQIQRGIVFAGESGFYFTDGWEVRKLSSSFNDTYAQYIQTAQQKRRINGAFDRTSKRVWWALQSGQDIADEVDTCFVLDSRYGLGVAGDDLENVRACFTTISGGTSFRPTALIFFNNDLYRADSRGYIFKHSSSYTSDPIIDTFSNPSTWATQAIIWDFKSFATSFGFTLKRKFVPRVVVSAECTTNASVQIVSINDAGRSEFALKPIRFRKLWTWGDPTKTWGKEGEIWNYKGIIEEERYINSNGLRCSYKQIQIVNAYVNIVASDNLTTGTGNAALNTFTLDDIVNYAFPGNLRGYFISFENDSYSKEFEILSNTTSTLTVLDPTLSIPEIPSKWIIRGYPKDEVFNMLSFALFYSPLGDPQKFQTVTGGGNA